MQYPKRILHVVGNMEAGGLETLIMNWYRAIDKTKIQFDFLVHKKDKSFYEDEITKLGGKVYHCSVLDDRNLFKYKKFLNSFFSQHKEYKIVHGHHSFLGFYYLRAAEKHNVPIRISHSHIASHSKGFRGLLKHATRFRFGKHANFHFSCSIKAGEYMYGRNSTFRVINNGIDTAKFTFSESTRQEYRKSLGVSGGQKVICHVGRFYDQKNHKFLIDIFYSFLQDNPNSILVLIGIGPLMNEIKKKAIKLGLANGLRFLGNIANVSGYLCASDIFVFPSLFEGLPLTLVEAQANGLPIVYSSEITKEIELTNLIHPFSLSESSVSWSKTISHILQEPVSNREEYSKLVKEANYDTKDIAKEMQDFYIA